MKNLTGQLFALLLPIAILGLVACGGGNEAGVPSGGDQPAPQQSAVPRAQQPMEQTETEPEKNFCAHLSSDDIHAAFGGTMELGTPEGTETGCNVPIHFGVDGNALAYGQISRGNYDAFRGYEDQSNVAFEYLEGLGQEAFILNNAQVCVLMNETDAYLVGAQIMAVAEPLPISQEQLKAGLIDLTAKLVSQL